MNCKKSYLGKEAVHLHRGANDKALLCHEAAEHLKALRDAYQAMCKAVHETPQANPSQSKTETTAVSRFDPLMAPYSALTSGITRFLGDYLKDKQYAPATQFIATQSAQLAMHLSTSPDPKLTLATSLPLIAAQATGVSKTKVLIASLAAYTGYMAYQFYYQPEACLTSGLNLVSSLAGTLVGDMAGHLAYDRFVGSQYPASRAKRVYDFRPRNELGFAITEKTAKLHKKA